MLIIGGFVSQNTNGWVKMDPALNILTSFPSKIGKVKNLVTDVGFFSDGNGGECQEVGIEPIMAVWCRVPNHVKLLDTLVGPVSPGEDATLRERKRYKLRDKVGKAFHALRRQVVEPMFGII
jgi:hypothetical protein